MQNLFLAVEFTDEKVVRVGSECHVHINVKHPHWA